MHWSNRLPRTACNEAREWARTQPSAQAAWDACERGDWMLWLLGHQAGGPGSDARKPLVLCCCECASLARRYTRGATRSAFDRALRTARSWARGRGATLDEVRDAAAAAAYAAAYAAAAAAYAAADAAAAAAYAAADADAARSRVRRRCAAIVRKHYPEAPRMKERA